MLFLNFDFIGILVIPHVYLIIKVVQTCIRLDIMGAFNKFKILFLRKIFYNHDL